MSHDSLWLIRQIRDPEMVWCNEWGWLDEICDECTFFSGEEKAKFNLPSEGEWEEVTPQPPKEHDPLTCGCSYLGNGLWSCGHQDNLEVTYGR